MNDIYSSYLGSNIELVFKNVNYFIYSGENCSPPCYCSHNNQYMTPAGYHPTKQTLNPWFPHNSKKLHFNVTKLS